MVYKGTARNEATSLNPVSLEADMTWEQIAELDDHELEDEIRRVQQIERADRELSELLNEKRRRQIAAVLAKADFPDA